MSYPGRIHTRPTPPARGVPVLRTAVGRFRAVAFLEGVSFLVLLGIAMPLKYFAGLPQAVLVVGWAHGLLFILYMVALARVTLADRWSSGRVAGALAASV